MRIQTSIAIVGGTGAEGSGLALRFAKAGARVRIGSRESGKAETAAARIAVLAVSGEVTGHANPDAVSGAGIVVLTVPLVAQIEILKSIRDRLETGTFRVDATVPLEIAFRGRLSRTLTLWDGSAAQQAARLLPAGIAVVSAFHSLSAEALAHLDHRVDCDTLICSDHVEAKATVCELAAMIPGVRGIDAGPLDNARFLESAAALLISLNLRHKVTSSGIRFTGLTAGGTRP